MWSTALHQILNKLSCLSAVPCKEIFYGKETNKHAHFTVAVHSLSTLLTLYHLLPQKGEEEIA